MRNQLFLKYMFFAALLTAILDSCAIREPPSPSIGLEPSKISQEALENASVTFQKFYKGTVDEKEITQLELALLEALDAFLQSTKGSLNEDYSSQELKYFFETYFLKMTVSSALLNELFFLKRAVIGGSTVRITKQEILFAKELVQFIARSARRFRIFMPISQDFFTLSQLKETDLNYRKDLFTQFLNDLKVQIRSDPSIPYEPERIPYLTHALAGIAKFESKTVLDSANKIKNLLLEFRELLLAAPKDRVFKVKDWKDLIDLSIDVSSIWFDYRRLQSGKLSFYEGSAPGDYVRTIHEATNLFDKVIDAWGGGFEHAQFFAWYGKSELFKEFRKSRFGRVEFLQSVLSFLSRRVLSNRDQRSQVGFTKGSTKRLRAMAEEWLSQVEKINEVAQYLDRSKCLEDLLLELAKLRKSDPSLEDSLKSFKTFFNGQSFTSREKFVLGFEPEEKQLMGDFIRGVQEKTLIKSVMSPTVLAYQGRDKFPSLVSFEVFVREVWPILETAEFVDRVNIPNREAAKRFREANLFTKASNGDLFLQPEEGVELMTYVVSAGIVSSKLYDALGFLCSKRGIDLLGKPLLEPQCVRSYLYGSLHDPRLEFYWNNQKVFLDYLNSLNSKKREGVKRNIEWAGRRYGFHPTRWFEASDFNSTVMMVHYVETIFARFDLDGSGTINYNESKAAFRVLKRELGTVLDLKIPQSEDSRSQLEAVFTWLLAKGYEPGSDPRASEGDSINPDFWSRVRSFLSYPDFIKWWLIDSWEFEADRSRIIAIFASLSRKNPTSMPPDYRPIE